MSFQRVKYETFIIHSGACVGLKPTINKEMKNKNFDNCGFYFSKQNNV